MEICFFGALQFTYAALPSILGRLGRLEEKLDAFLRRWPLVISLLEAVFVGLLCANDQGLQSPFLFYYLLSLLVCAIRYTPTVTSICSSPTAGCVPDRKDPAPNHPRPGIIIRNQTCATSTPVAVDSSMERKSSATSVVSSKRAVGSPPATSTATGIWI